ncbi:hypothetical protein ACTFIV_001141 [Dictyostelium citrinum]
MISLKSNYIIYSIFIILQIFNVFGDNTDYLYNLYAVTSNPVGSYVIVVNTFNDQVLVNTSLNLNDLKIQSFLTVEPSLNVLSLLCEDSNNTNYLILADVKSGEIKKSKGIQNFINLKNNTNYVYSNATGEVYLPTYSKGQLVILRWNFNQEESDYVEIFPVVGVEEFDNTYEPKGVLSSNGGLYIFYKSTDMYNNSRVALLDLNNTDSSGSTSETVIQIVNTYIFNGAFDADEVGMIYMDTSDYNLLYAIRNLSGGETNACSLLLEQTDSVCDDANIYLDLNPFNYKYNPYFLSSDLSSFITLQTRANGTLEFEVWSGGFNYENTNKIHNRWQSTNLNNCTHFKN